MKSISMHDDACSNRYKVAVARKYGRSSGEMFLFISFLVCSRVFSCPRAPLKGLRQLVIVGLIADK